MSAAGDQQKLHNQLPAAGYSLCASTTSAALRAFTSLAAGIQPEMHVLPADLCL